MVDLATRECFSEESQTNWWSPVSLDIVAAEVFGFTCVLRDKGFPSIGLGILIRMSSTSEGQVPDPTPTLSDHREHRFLDEAGDTAFYGPKRRMIVGTFGVSKAFYLGCVKFKCPLDDARMVVLDAQRRVRENSVLTRFQSVQKRLAKGGFHFHAKIDPPPVKELFFEALRDLSCSLEIIVARKDPKRFSRVHHDKEDQFYADILGHLLKNKLKLGGRLTMTIAQRGSATRSVNLDRALSMALERARRKNRMDEPTTKVAFDVTEPTREVLLTVADYLSWSVQRVFEMGDTAYYDSVRDRISVVQDIYDVRNFSGSRNWYGTKRPLTAENKLSPPAS